MYDEILSEVIGVHDFVLVKLSKSCIFDSIVLLFTIMMQEIMCII